MGRFADAHLGAMDADGTDDFARLIDVPDADLFNWVTDAEPVPDEHDTPVFRALRAFNRSQPS